MKRLTALFLALIMVMALIPGALAADEYKAGVEITDPTAEDLAGEYGTAYTAAGHKATFTYVAGADQDIAKIEVFGDFQWMTEELAQQRIASNYTENVRILSAYEVVEGAYHAGYANPGGAGEYPEGIRYHGPSADASFINYTMTEISDGVYRVAMPMMAGFYRYMYRITDSNGVETLVGDPGNEFGYTIDKHTTPAPWALIRVGTADEVSETEAYAYPIEDESLRGTVVRTTIKTYLGTDQNICIYLPYDYDANDPVPYKTIYVSHGSGENEDTWITAAALPNMMDRLTAEGRVDHTIAVTMDNCIPLNNFGDDVPRNFVESLIPYIEANYNVSKSADDRAICGSSLGGQMVYKMMGQYPDLMKYYGSWSYRRVMDINLLNADALKDKYICLGRANCEPATPAMVGRYNDLKGIGLENVVLYTSTGSHDWRNWRDMFQQFVDYIGWTNGISAEKIRADAIAEDTADVKVIYEGDEELTTVRMTIACDLDIADISSENSFEYNPATGKIIVYAPDGQAVNKDLFTITFSIKGVTDGKYPVKLTLIQATEEADDVEVKTINGHIIIDNTVVKGDINGDGEVNNADLILIARYLVDLVKFNAKQLQAADYDSDGAVNNRDLVLIARALVAA